MIQKISSTRKLITVLHGCGVLFSVKANLFIDPSCIKSDGKLDVFVIIDNARYPISQHEPVLGCDCGYSITMSDMNKKDWEKYNYKNLVK